METFLLATGVVALAEIGDKTQLLAFLLAARYRKPLPIIGGIFVTTVLNHALAGALGLWLQSLVSARALRIGLGVSFIAMAAWMLVPDKIDDVQANRAQSSVFMATLIAFFFAEIGDKTQIATIALAAKSTSYAAVVLGTTAGMMIANVPAVIVGEKLAHRMPVQLVHRIAAAIFVLLGVATLMGLDRKLGL
jgi:Ca2+/H+ antiporter, TMEM165/GDT1 family